MRHDTAAASRRREAGFGLLEMIIVLAILGALSSILILSMGSTKQASREKVSMSRMQEARTSLMRARDRDQMVLSEVLAGANSWSACASVNPMPPVAQLGGGCKAAWDAVNARLVPYVGSLGAAARLMTDGSERPILVRPLETVGCPASTASDELRSVHPTGDRSKPEQVLAIPPSGYGC